MLPFVNLTPDRENEYFSDGMTEELSNALARVPGLRVAARTSAFAFKGKDLDAREIAARLGVSALVEGSVRKIGNRIRLTAQLIDAADGCHLWSETYERTLDDVFALQEELARAIVAALPVSAHAVPHLVPRTTPALDAYTLYLRGRYAALKRTVEGLALGIEYFEQALEKDPHYALAHTRAGGMLGPAGIRGVRRSRSERRDAASQGGGARSVAARPEDRHRHTPGSGSSTFCSTGTGLRPRASCGRRCSSNRENAYAEVWYAVLLAQLHRHGESLRRIHQAEALDPLSPAVRLTVGRCYYFARRYAGGAECFGACGGRSRGTAVAMWWARALACTGRHGEALEELEKITETGHQRSTLSGFRALVLAGMGRRDEAVALCREIQREVQEGNAPYSSTFLATALFQLGERDAAFETLEGGVRTRSAYMAFLGEPVCDPLREDPRYSRLLQRLGLPG